MKAPFSDIQSSNIQNSKSQKSDIQKTDTQIGPDPLLLELANCEARLHAWICSSAMNAELFAKDPVSAMRAADLGIPEVILEDLADVIGSIAQKLAS